MAAAQADSYQIKVVKPSTRPQLNFLHMRNICSKTFQPRINILNLSNYCTVTAYEMHVQSMDRPTLPQCVQSDVWRQRRLWSALAVHMLCLSLPLTSVLEREGLRKISSKHMRCIWSRCCAYAQLMLSWVMNIIARWICVISLNSRFGIGIEYARICFSSGWNNSKNSSGPGSAFPTLRTATRVFRRWQLTNNQLW